MSFATLHESDLTRPRVNVVFRSELKVAIAGLGAIGTADTRKRSDVRLVGVAGRDKAKAMATQEQALQKYGHL
jgi:hypothetical protein